MKNVTITTPITGLELQAKLVEAAQGSTPGDIYTTAITAPVGSAVAGSGTAGSTNYTYVVAAVGDVGEAPASGVSNSTGNATLSSTNYNTITWRSVVGYTYHVYRSTSSGTPSSTGLIATVTATSTSSSAADTGITATGNVPTGNTTGAIKAAGPIFGGGVAFVGGSGPQTINTSSTAVTATVAQISNDYLTRAGAAANTLTLPSAAAVVAALPGIPVNHRIAFDVQNKCSGSCTVAVGSGGTADSGSTLAIVSLHVRKFIMVVTVVTAGSEAYSLLTGPDSLY